MGQQGFFITIEGIDGVGKTTQADLLAEHLRVTNRNVFRTREPGGTRLGQVIRRVLLDSVNADMSERTEVLLYAADRAQHVTEIIRPALRSGHVVICDRYVDSSLAYQGYGLNLDPDWVWQINAWATENLVPDLTIYLDQDPLAVLRRMRGDRIEQRTLAYYHTVREGFLDLAARHGRRICVVEANQTIEAISRSIAAIVERRIPG